LFFFLLVLTPGGLARFGYRNSKNKESGPIRLAENLGCERSHAGKKPVSNGPLNAPSRNK
jgi:hypothetical protein